MRFWFYARCALTRSYLCYLILSTTTAGHLAPTFRLGRSACTDTDGPRLDRAHRWRSLATRFMNTGASGAVKALHAFLQSAAPVLGGLGIASMHDTHSGARHSNRPPWLGCRFCHFCIQWFVGWSVSRRVPCQNSCLSIGSARDGRHGSEFADYSRGRIRAVGLVWKPQNSTEFPNDAGFVSVGVWELANAASLASAGLLLFLVLTMMEAQRIKMGSKKHCRCGICSI